MQIVGEKVEPLPVPSWQMDCNSETISVFTRSSHIGLWVEKCFQRYTFTAEWIYHDACDHFSVDHKEKEF